MIAWAAIEYATSEEHDLNGMVSHEAGALNDGPYGVQIRPRWPLGVDYRDWCTEEDRDSSGLTRGSYVRPHKQTEQETSAYGTTPLRGAGLNK
jgi:hypothetical protein